MAPQEQNKIVNILKFVGDKYYDCYINPNYITRIVKHEYSDCYEISIIENVIPLFNVKTKEQLYEFLDYIHTR